MHHKNQFKNGLRIITEKLESTKAVTVLLLAGAGSRYEHKKINGISHFLEHMFFKGAKKYKNAREVSEAIDGVGGEFNAFTGKEYAGYYVKVASENIEKAMDVISDMLMNAKFDPKEIDKERGVIMEEYNMYQDTPMYQIGWDFEKLVFDDQPLGWDQVGTPELIKSVTQKQFQDYKGALYSPDNMVLALAGDISDKKGIELAEKYFKFGDEKKKFEFNPYKKHDTKERVYLHSKKTEQAHLVIGGQSNPETHKNHWAEKLLSIILGGNMSSRMFMSVREARGLCYYIHTSSDNFKDTGIFSTGAGIQVSRIDEAVQAILAEYEKIRAEKIPQAELEKAINFMKGKMILNLEDSEEYAHLLGKYELLHGKIMRPEEILKEVEKVTVEDIHRVASQILAPENLKIGIIGPYDEKGRFEKFLN
ncbi:insulinase family protein [Candidatus Peregrinibacteria bacterium]|nr:insulinase family protein [Candidatus Peregrinibacteria bacterium]